MDGETQAEEWMDDGWMGEVQTDKYLHFQLYCDHVKACGDIVRACGVRV